MTLVEKRNPQQKDVTVKFGKNFPYGTFEFDTKENFRLFRFFFKSSNSFFQILVLAKVFTKFYKSGFRCFGEGVFYF